ncbi:MAG: PAS domain-containing protein [Rhodospirillales bacterium]|nr:PAS domain-containing protein [Rhodospirillales bacterium]
MTAENAAFLQIVENAADGIVIHRDFHPLYMNPAFVRLFGYSAASEFSDQNAMLLLLAPEDRSHLRKACATCMDGQAFTQPLFFTGLTKDRSPLHLKSRFHRVDWAGETAVCQTLSLGVERNDTPETPNDSLRPDFHKSQAQLVNALNQISSAIALFDKDDRLTYCNAKYGRYIADKSLLSQGITFEEILRISIQNGVIPQAQADPEAWIAGRLQTHRRQSGISEISRSDGSWESVHEQKTDDGSILLFSTDITDQKKADQAREESEAYLKAFIENSPAAVFLKDKNANFIYVNETYREWQNVNNEDIIGSSIYNHLPPEDAAPIAEQDRLALEERKSSNVESRTVFPDGVERSVMAIRFPVIGADGEVIGVSGFLTDTSDHYRAKEELELKTDLYTSVLDNLPISVNVKDLDGRYLVANKQQRLWRALTQEQVLGRTTDELFTDPVDRVDSRNAQEAEVLNSRKIVRREEWRQCEDGVNRFLEWIKFPVLDRDGNIAGIGTIGTDLTDRKTVEQHLRTAKEAAEFANRAKSEFLAHMSHELRTPLNAVIGFSQLMMEHTFGELGHANYDDYAKDIYAAGNHLLNVISDILDISKIEAGEIELDNDQIDVGQLMASSIKMMRSRADAADITLTLKLPRDLPLFRGDELRMRQILLNLLSNSVKFTRPGGRVSLSASMAPDGAMSWEVADTGIGIAEDDIARVMKPFEQARQGFQLSHEGTGLGLYLTQTLTELHGGTLTLNSKLNAGTVVQIAFPAERTVGAPTHSGQAIT